MKNKTAIVLLIACLAVAVILGIAAYRRPTVAQRLGNKIDRDMNRAADFFKR